MPTGAILELSAFRIAGEGRDGLALTSNEYVTVDLNGGTHEMALDVFRALGGAFTPQPSTDAFFAYGSPGPTVGSRRFLVDGPGRRIGAGHRLVGEISADITGAPERIAYVLDALRAFAEVDEVGTAGGGGETRTTVQLRPA